MTQPLPEGCPERIHLPDFAGEHFAKREFVERKMVRITPDTIIAYRTGPRPCDFELNRELFPLPFVLVMYDREASGSDWFVRRAA